MREVDSEVKLVCAARGSPIPTIEWRKNGRILTVNSTKFAKRKERVSELKIAQFKPSDRGEYTCKAQNYENGTAEIKVTVGKEFSLEMLFIHFLPLSLQTSKPLI